MTNRKSSNFNPQCASWTPLPTSQNMSRPRRSSRPNPSSACNALRSAAKPDSRAPKGGTCQAMRGAPRFGHGAVDARRVGPAKRSILINVNGELKPRAEAVVSVFDSGFMLGDGVWEGLRVHKGRLAFLDRHLDRLFEGAKAIAMDIGLIREELTRRLYDTLDANTMDEGVHVRLMVTRGVRSTPYQDPRVVVGGATIVIIPEYKEPDPAIYERGLKLFTVHVRRGDPGGAGPEDQLALEAQLHPRLDPGDAGRRRRGADARSARLRRDLQLDPFLHRPQGRGVDLERQILPRRDHARLALEIAREAGIPAIEKDFSLTDVYGADEAFVTGTFAGIVPVREVDGRELDVPRADGRAAAAALRRAGRARGRASSGAP